MTKTPKSADHAEQPFADNVYAVILAGGSGTRFWPKSRHLRPKQLCRIGDHETTMLELTLSRLDGLVPPERRLIVTHKDQLNGTREVLGSQHAVLLAEPEAKNTAAALALAAIEIEALARPGTKPIMISLHADHLVADVGTFRETLRRAVATAGRGVLTLIGVVPEYPETGYGYIEQGEGLAGDEFAAKVHSFREKPAAKVAKDYVDSGRFFWNAGLFVWQTEVLLKELMQTVPVTVETLRTAQHQAGGRLASGAPSGTDGDRAMILKDAYAALPKISIDHAVLEVSRNVAVIPAAFGWQDIGSWDALSRGFAPDAEGNLIFGEGYLLDSRDTTVDTDGPFVACIGLKDLVVVVNQGAVLVCPKSRSQDVKEITSWLQAKGRRDLL